MGNPLWKNGVFKKTDSDLPFLLSKEKNKSVVPLDTKIFQHLSFFLKWLHRKNFQPYF